MLRALIVLPLALYRGESSLALGALRESLLAFLAGGLAGAAYVFVGRPLRRVPAYGNMLAGIFTVASYFGVLVLLWRGGSPTDALSIRTESSRFALIILTLIGGILLGNEFDKRSLPASPIDAPAA